MAKLPAAIRRMMAQSACLLSLLTVGLGADADDSEARWQSLVEVTNAVQQNLEDYFLAQGRYAEVSVRTSSPDNRLKLAECSQPLSISLPNAAAGGRVTSQVVCQSDLAQWSIYVISQVQLMAEVVVARVPLLRGQAIAADDLGVAIADVSRLSQGYFTLADDIIGMEPRRSINTGEQIRAQWLIAPKAVKRGERVTIIASSESISVATAGTALTDGRLGEQIRVRNDRSDRVVKGVVSDDKTVSISF